MRSPTRISCTRPILLPTWGAIPRVHSCARERDAEGSDGARRPARPSTQLMAALWIFLMVAKRVEEHPAFGGAARATPCA